MSSVCLYFLIWARRRGHYYRPAEEGAHLHRLVMNLNCQLKRDAHFDRPTEEGAHLYRLIMNLTCQSRRGRTLTD